MPFVVFGLAGRDHCFGIFLWLFTFCYFVSAMLFLSGQPTKHHRVCFAPVSMKTFLFLLQEEIKFLKDKHRKEKQSSGSVTAKQVRSWLSFVWISHLTQDLFIATFRNFRPSACANFDVICQARATVFHRDIQTLGRELKIWRAAEYFWRNSRCLDSRWNTFWSVWYIISIETKTKE